MKRLVLKGFLGRPWVIVAGLIALMAVVAIIFQPRACCLCVAWVGIAVAMIMALIMLIPLTIEGYMVRYMVPVGGLILAGIYGVCAVCAVVGKIGEYRARKRGVE